MKTKEELNALQAKIEAQDSPRLLADDELAQVSGGDGVSRDVHIPGKINITVNGPLIENAYLYKESPN